MWESNVRLIVGLYWLPNDQTFRCNLFFWYNLAVVIIFLIVMVGKLSSVSDTYLTAGRSSVEVFWAHAIVVFSTLPCGFELSGALLLYFLPTTDLQSTETPIIVFDYIQRFFGNGNLCDRIFFSDEVAKIRKQFLRRTDSRQIQFSNKQSVSGRQKKGKLRRPWNKTALLRYHISRWHTARSRAWMARRICILSFLLLQSKTEELLRLEVWVLLEVEFRHQKPNVVFLCCWFVVF